MINVKLGKKIFKDVDKIKVNTDDGSAVVLDEPPEKYDGEIFSEPGTVSEVMGLNIAYGDTAPEDTSKLWVKCEESRDVNISSNIGTASFQMEASVTLLNRPSIRPAVQIGSKVLLYNGYGYTSHTDTTAETFKQSGHIYDLETDTFSSWSISNQTTQYYEYSTGVCVDNTGYLCGGYNKTRYNYDSSITRVYVPDTTPTGANMLSGMDTCKAYCSAAAVGSKIYIFGGLCRKSDSQTINSVKTTSTIHMADTKLGEATRLSTLYDYGYKAAAAAVDDKIYLFGGGYRAADGGPLYVTKNIAIFDTNTYEITILDQKLPDIALGISGIAVGSKIYLFGGRWGGDLKMSKDIYAFETTTGELELIGQMASAGETVFLALWNNYIYMLTGYGEWNGYRSTVDRISLKTLLDSGKLLIETGVNKNTFSLISNPAINVEVGIKNVYLGNSEGYAEKVPAALYVDGAWTEI